MSCPVRSVVTDKLKEKKLIGEGRTIVDSKGFDEYNKKLTDKARNKYGVKSEGNLLNRIVNTFKSLDSRTNTYRRDSINSVERFEFNDKFADELDIKLKEFRDRKSIITETELTTINKNLNKAGLPVLTYSQFRNLSEQEKENIKKCYG